MNDVNSLRNSQKCSLHYDEEALLLIDPGHPFTTSWSSLSAKAPNKSNISRSKNSMASLSIEGYRKAVWSPSFYPSMSSCVLLVLTVDGHAFLYAKEPGPLYSSMKIFFSFNYYLEALGELDFDTDEYIIKCNICFYYLLFFNHGFCFVAVCWTEPIPNTAESLILIGHVNGYVRFVHVSMNPFSLLSMQYFPLLEGDGTGDFENDPSEERNLPTDISSSSFELIRVNAWRIYFSLTTACGKVYLWAVNLEKSFPDGTLTYNFLYKTLLDNQSGHRPILMKWCPRSILEKMASNSIRNILAICKYNQISTFKFLENTTHEEVTFRVSSNSEIVSFAWIPTFCEALTFYFRVDDSSGSSFYISLDLLSKKMHLHSTEKLDPYELFTKSGAGEGEEASEGDGEGDIFNGNIVKRAGLRRVDVSFFGIACNPSYFYRAVLTGFMDKRHSSLDVHRLLARIDIEPNIFPFSKPSSSSLLEELKSRVKVWHGWYGSLLQDQLFRFNVKRSNIWEYIQLWKSILLFKDSSTGLDTSEESIFNSLVNIHHEFIEKYFENSIGTLDITFKKMMSLLVNIQRHLLLTLKKPVQNRVIHNRNRGRFDVERSCVVQGQLEQVKGFLFLSLCHSYFAFLKNSLSNPELILSEEDQYYFVLYWSFCLCHSDSSFKKVFLEFVKVLNIEKLFETSKDSFTKEMNVTLRMAWDNSFTIWESSLLKEPHLSKFVLFRKSSALYKYYVDRLDKCAICKSPPSEGSDVCQSFKHPLLRSSISGELFTYYKARKCPLCLTFYQSLNILQPTTLFYPLRMLESNHITTCYFCGSNLVFSHD